MLKMTLPALLIIAGIAILTIVVFVLCIRKELK
jgi:hypothetical protein